MRLKGGYFAPVLPQSTNDVLLVIAFILTFVLSYLSYRFIETPIRLKDFRANPKRLFIPTFAVMIIIASFGYYLEYHNGIPKRYPTELQKIIAAPTDKNLEDSKYMDLKPQEVAWDKYPTLGEKNAPHYSFIVMGDSHADAISPGFDILANQLGIKGKLLAASGNLPFFGVNWGGDDTLSQVKDKWLILIKQHPHIKVVFLVGRFGIYANGYGYTDKNNEFGNEEDVSIVLWDKYSKSHDNISHNPEVFERGLLRTLQVFKQLNIKVVFVEDVPEIGWNVPETLSKLYILRNVKTQKISPVTYKDYLERQKFVLNALKIAQQKYAFDILDTAKVLCKNDKPCTILDKKGYPLYLDSNHLTNHSAYYVVEHDKAFKEKLRDFAMH